MSNSLLKILVVSDLHCKHPSSDKNKEGQLQRSTILYSDLLRNNSHPIHPIQAFINLVSNKKDELKCDLVLCPGDITDKIDPQGFITGWSFLEEMKGSVRADALFATVGNHDVDSRRIDRSKGPFSIAKSIKYNFPIEDEILKREFWEKHFCIFENEKYQLLIFNSSHSHLDYLDAGSAKIDQETLLQMGDELSKLRYGKIRLAMCHHHPITHSNISYPDSDVINKGDKFLDLLNTYDFSVLIHGHKHEIKARYYNKLLIFGSGSFSSRENIQETESENVFHTIEFNSVNEGIIKTWIYGSRSGWHQKRTNLIFPIFGFKKYFLREELRALAESVSKWIIEFGNGENENFGKVGSFFPDITYMLPDQINIFCEILESEFSFTITYSPEGFPILISKLSR